MAKSIQPSLFAVSQAERLSAQSFLHLSSEYWCRQQLRTSPHTCLSNCCAGRTRIRLKSTGEVFTLVPPNCKAHNVVVGRTWVDSFGDYSLFNTTTGAKAEMYFTPCGWFDSGHYEVILQGSSRSNPTSSAVTVTSTSATSPESPVPDVLPGS